MFSIVIPAYNAEKFIAISVKSVLNQTHGDFELIIVDDGSEDETKKVIKQFHDDRITYIYQCNGGVSSARNAGILASKGEYVCFLDSDDEWKSNHLEVMSSLIKKYKDCGMYITGYDIRLRNGEVVHKSHDLLKSISYEDFMSNDGYEISSKYGYFFNTNTICCRREVFDKVGLFVTGVKNGEDDDMWFRIFAYYPVAISKQTTTIYDRSNCGATRQRVNDSDRTFLGRVEGILNSSEVPQYRKASLMIWIEKNKLSQVRKSILMGNKKEAISLLRKVDYKKVSPKRYYETLVSLIVPTRIIQQLIDRRDAAYFGVKEE